MSTFGEQIETALNALASGTIAANRFVKRTSAGAVAQATASGQAVHGVAWAGASDGQSVRLVRVGVVQVEAGAAVAAGAVVQSDASGRAITATINGYAAGVALEAAGTAGDLIHVDLFGVVAAGAGGQRVATGQATPVAGTTTVVTGLALVTAAVVSLNSAPTLTHQYSTVSIGDQAGSPAAGSIIISHWKPTATGDVTPAAASTPWGVVNWVAVGT